MLSMVACSEMLPLLPDDDVDAADEGCETADSTSASPVASHRSSVAQQGPDDDELTSLSWLQNRNLLRVLRASEASAAAQNGSRISGADAEYEDDTSASGAGFIPSDSPTSDYGDDCGDGSLEENFGHGSSEGKYDLRSRHSKPPYSFSSLIFMAIEASTSKALPVKDIYAWILGHFPYFASAPTGWKNSVRHNLSLNKCFRKVEREKGHMNIGKGSLWCIDPEFRPNLLQALRKVPYYSYQHLQLFTATTATSTPHTANRVTLVPSSQKCHMVSTKLAGNLPNPELFPYLSKRLAASTIKGTTQQEVDAAATMLALKNGPGLVTPAATTSESSSRKRVCAEENGIAEKRRKKWENRRTCERTLWPRRPTSIAVGEFEGVPAPLPSASVPVMTVVTCCPSEDHTYSTLSSPSPSSIDAAFEFSEPSRDGSVGSDADAEDEDDDYDAERAITGAHRSSFFGQRDENELRNGFDFENSNSEQVEDEDEEQMKIVQGADALMNLAGIRGRERRIRRAAMQRAQLRWKWLH